MASSKCAHVTVVLINVIWGRLLFDFYSFVELDQERLIVDKVASVLACIPIRRSKTSKDSVFVALDDWKSWTFIVTILMESLSPKVMLRSLKNFS